MRLKSTGEGAVLPPGSASPQAALPAGGYQIIIDGLDESGMVRCVYPDGFVKHHQAESISELAGKVVNQLRGRYGAQEVSFASIPAQIAAGENFSVEG